MCIFFCLPPEYLLLLLLFLIMSNDQTKKIVDCSFLNEFSNFTSVFDQNHDEEYDEWIQKCFGRVKTVRKDFVAHLSGHFLQKCSGDNGNHTFDKFKYIFLLNNILLYLNNNI